ncbi:Bromodomain-containing protein [Daedaleopsis nitida]|nr:Bromodomain-containing protein [Daedaleopsis nitida]
MSKREARTFAAAGVDVDAPRAKRRKDVPATSHPASDSKQNADATAVNGGVEHEDENAAEVVEDRETVREKGLQLWQTVKDAVNKAGHIASFQFMRLPSKRQYPDYYIQIKHPIALDDIKSKLDLKQYVSISEVRQDLETCFRNAKRYNMKESQIWKDAKLLHKLVIKEYGRMTGIKEEGHEDWEGGSDDEEKKKKPTAYKLLKTRLQRLVDKKDPTGRVLSVEFMQLPNRKAWPMYYAIIKKPQCLQNIFKKLKQKEYPMPVDFANDVELVFSNALEFNQEHTQIWEDAVALREFFRKLMSDLPEPFSIPTYANAGQHATKIKLKVPQPAAAAPPPPPVVVAPPPSLPSSNSIVLPAPSKKETSKVVPGPSPLPIAARPPAGVVTAPTPTKPQTQPTRPTALAPTPTLPAVVPQAPKPAYTPPVQPQAIAHTTTNIAPAPLKASSTSPAIPSTSSVATLPHATISTLPRRRRLILDHVDGVKTWSLRLNSHESAVVVSEVSFRGEHHGDDDESSGDEEPARQEEEEEEEEEAAAPVKKRKKRGPGRPRKRARVAKAAVKKSPSKGKAVDGRPGEVQVKLNGVLIPGTGHSAWEVQLPFGGGMVWKVYLDRASH